MKKINYFSLLLPQLRQISTKTIRSPHNLYDSLSVSAKATQADIKSAYYKLSMIYHPDKNKDSVDAAKKFRDITEAYEVLGNVRTRKLYDRALYLGGVDHHSNSQHHQQDEVVNKFYKSRETRSRPPAPQHERATVYNFDEWSRQHYGATFQRDIRNRKRNQTTKTHKENVIEDIKSEKMILFIGFLCIVTSLMFYEDKSNDKVISIGGSNFSVTRKN